MPPKMHSRNFSRRNPIAIRHIIPVTYTREQAVGMTAFCRKYLIVGKHGEPKGVEAVRLLMVIGLTPGAGVRTRAAVAAHINMQAMVSTVTTRTRFNALDEEDPEPDMVVKQRLWVRIDRWISNQLAFHSKNYRDGRGGILDNKMVYEFTLRGLMDPDLDKVATTYSKLVYPMRSRMLKLEDEIREAVRMVRREWMASMGGEPMPASLGGQ